jgi:DeoR/GlpR family transcriptional regulator of sugar metabolism
MLMAERHSRLQELVERRGMCDLEALAAELGVSQSTIRRDLDALEERGLVKRTHGGVIWVGDAKAGLRGYAFGQRTGLEVEAKQRIARAARALVQPGQTILIDGGTTTYYLARELVGTPLQIVTNSLPIADLFLDDENVELILAGGLLYPRYGVLLGPMAESTLGAIHANMLFFSAAGLHDGTLYNQNLLLVQTERRMMQQAQEIVLLLDSTKFGQKALVALCELVEVDVVVCDAGTSEEQRRQVIDAGKRLVVAE